MYNIENCQYLLCISIVSHGQGMLIAPLLADIKRTLHAESALFKIIVTLNITEDESFITPFIGDNFAVIRNNQPKGFGANHNAAFAESNAKFFAVVNPDIRIQTFDYRFLMSTFANDKIAAVAPLVLSANGTIEDSARHFPTFARLLKRVLLRKRNSDYKFDRQPLAVDWVAGMFVVFRKEAYSQVGGFDDLRFFMYLEDADICERLHKKGFVILVNPNIYVTHLAQRASRQNLKHMYWHAISAIRYLTGC